MVHIKSEQYPKRVTPYKILKKKSFNAYALNLLVDIGINIFNIEDFTLYSKHADIMTYNKFNARLPSVQTFKKEIEYVIDY